MKRVLAVLVVVAVAFAMTSCSASDVAAPHCTDSERLGIVAQSVPTATFVPCITTLAAGWHIAAFEVHDGGTRLSLESDRAAHSVRVRLQRRCALDGATPVSPRDESVRTYQKVVSIAPDYAGRLFDVFPGGCITYDFRFRRGPHIALIDDFESIIGLMPRRVLRERLHNLAGVDLR